MGDIIKFKLNKNDGVNNLVHEYPETLIFCDKKYLNKDCYVLMETRKKSNFNFLDFYFIQNDKKYFIGRFNKYQTTDYNIDFDINNSFLIIYTRKFDSELKTTIVNNILCLYDIKDKTEVVGTFNELSMLYNKYAQNKLVFKSDNNDKLIYRTDIERIRKNR